MSPLKVLLIPYFSPPSLLCPTLCPWPISPRSSLADLIEKEFTAVAKSTECKSIKSISFSKSSKSLNLLGKMSHWIRSLTGMKCSPENCGLKETLFFSLRIIDQPPPESLPPGVLELLNHQAEGHSIL